MKLQNQGRSYCGPSLTALRCALCVYQNGINTEACIPIVHPFKSENHFGFLQAGLIPRLFQNLFQRISDMEREQVYITDTPRISQSLDMAQALLEVVGMLHCEGKHPLVNLAMHALHARHPTLFFALRACPACLASQQHSHKLQICRGMGCS